MSQTIIGCYLDKFFEGSEDVAKKVYTHPKERWQIWEIEDSMLGYMCEQSEDEFYEQAGEDTFWRYSSGTVLRKPDKKCMINGKELIVWDISLEDDESYDCLLDYLCDIGISTETNLIAAFKDLAKTNGISIPKLLNTYECEEVSDDRTGTD